MQLTLNFDKIWHFLTHAVKLIYSLNKSNKTPISTLNYSRLLQFKWAVFPPQLFDMKFLVPENTLASLVSKAHGSEYVYVWVCFSLYLSFFSVVLKAQAATQMKRRFLSVWLKLQLLHSAWRLVTATDWTVGSNLTAPPTTNSHSALCVSAGFYTVNVYGSSLMTKPVGKRIKYIYSSTI